MMSCQEHVSPAYSTTTMTELHCARLCFTDDRCTGFSVGALRAGHTGTTCSVFMDVSWTVTSLDPRDDTNTHRKIPLHL